MATEKQEIKRFAWTELLNRSEKNGGVAKATIQESFNVVNSEIKSIIENDRIEGGITVIKTPIGAIINKFIPAHTETDEKGNKWEYSDSYGVAMTPPTEYSKIANTGFECTRKAIKA